MFFRSRCFYWKKVCVLPQGIQKNNSVCLSERTSLCSSKKASLTVEAALILPFFLMILIAFFSFFGRYTMAAELKTEAAAEAKKIGAAIGSSQRMNPPEITIYRSGKPDQFWINPFMTEERITQRAVCRGWIGFTELDTAETYVYVTPDGNVYHLYRDCTHLELSVRRVSLLTAKSLKNDYGQKYRACEVCGKNCGGFVYITSEGNRYHSRRNCSGLKRTIRQVPIREAEGRSCCIRCMSRGE